MYLISTFVLLISACAHQPQTVYLFREGDVLIVKATNRPVVVLESYEGKNRCYPQPTYVVQFADQQSVELCDFEMKGI